MTSCAATAATAATTKARSRCMDRASVLTGVSSTKHSPMTRKIRRMSHIRSSVSMLSGPASARSMTGRPNVATAAASGT